MITETSGTAAAIKFRTWFHQKVLGHNRSASWPMSKYSVVTGARLIKVGIGSAPGLSRGCYIQGINGIEIGDYVLVAPNVGIISANHNIYNHSIHDAAPPIKIGHYCWLGYGCSIMPGVELGPHTTVAAGAVVTKSFPSGYCVLAGVPAVVIKEIDRNAVVEHKNRIEYRGYHKV